MFSEPSSLLPNFFIVGINYKKTDASLRGKYAISREQYQHLLALAPSFHISEFFVLSTCNRTEIYGFAENPESLCEFICTQTEGSLDNFIEMAYTRAGEQAIEHLFDVAAGLDSQILGDYEIVGQIKNAVKTAKENGFVHSFTERLVNTVLQASKRIKKDTLLSGGTVSVSFAAVQYIREKMDDAGNKNILLLGTGKIGKNTCKNLVDYLGAKNITLINRTEEKAVSVAKELGVKAARLEDLDSEIDKADIIFVATNSDSPVIMGAHLDGGNEKLIVDLSIPYNVETAASELPNVTLVNVDELSRIKDETLQKRIAEVPKAKEIIARYRQEFIEWYDMRRHVPVLKAVKSKLVELKQSNFYTTTYSSGYGNNSETFADEKIQRIINGMAVKMREQNRQGCSYIEAINEYIAAATI